MQKENFMQMDFLTINHQISENPKPSDFSMHTHETCELCYFISGAGVFHVEGTDYPLQSGDLLLMDAFESHYIEIQSPATYERYVIRFKKEDIEKIDRHGKLLSPFENRKPGTQNLYSRHNFDSPLYALLLQNIVEGVPKNPAQVTTSFFALLNELSKAFETSDFSKEVPSETQLMQIIRYISENLTASLTLDTICKTFYISKSQLIRIFKKNLGTTVWKYITVKRLMQAKAMLRGGLSPSAVYLKSGFSDYSVFYKAFKKQFGYPPRACTHSQKDE